MPWPHFEKEKTVVGWSLLDLIDWVWESNAALSSETVPQEMPVITMPPLQRSAVWRPKQVIDLWDSLMRGLPIGTFYLVSANGLRDVVDLPTDTTRQFPGKGFDLLDGQQRVRALLVGAVGFKEERRQLWVDLGAKKATEHPCLLLTSKAQPFGYDTSTGQKLRLDNRRVARRLIEMDAEEHVHPISLTDEQEEQRRAYDHDLFDGPVVQNGKPLQPQPPLPYGATRGQTFPLPELLHVWRNGANCDAESRIAALRTVVGEKPSLEALTALHRSFCRVETAQVALMLVDPNNFRSRDEDLLALFERIGAGGTALRRCFHYYR